MFLEFIGKDDSFIGIIQSLEPFVVVKHCILDGCHSESECDDVEKTDYALRPMTRSEVFEALY